MFCTESVEPCSISLLQRCLSARSLVRVTIYSSLNEVPRQVWDQFATKGGLLLNVEALQALEQDADPHSYRYVVFSRNGEEIGIAFFMAIHYQGISIHQLIQRSSPRLSSLLRKLKTGVKPVQGVVLSCGHPVTPFERGYVFRDDVEEDVIADALEQAAGLVRTGLQISQKHPQATLLQGSFHPSALERRGYSRFQSMPRMQITLNPAWENFQEFLESLTSKYRIKAKRADTKSAELQVHQLSVHELMRFIPDMKRLHEDMLIEADFRLQAMQIERLTRLVKRCPDQVKIYGYFLEDHMLGFRVSFLHHCVLHAPLVGFDPSFNRLYSIYPRMLNDYLREAIEARCESLDLGRTAEEIKSTIGAVALPESFLLSHHGLLMRWWIPLIAKLTSYTPPHLHSPFKQVDPTRSE